MGYHCLELLGSVRIIAIYGDEYCIMSSLNPLMTMATHGLSLFELFGSVRTIIIVWSYLVQSGLSPKYEMSIA